MPSTQNATDYLTKHVLIQHNIVTYRSLSRELGIHVESAKQELAYFYQGNSKGKQRAHATYLICGEVTPCQDAGDVDMDAEDEEGLNMYDAEPVPRWEVVLVDEDKLEEYKSRFTKVASVSIHSLAPTRLVDADLLAEPLEIVRQFDSSKEGSDLEKAASLGRLVGEHAKIGKAVRLSASLAKPDVKGKGKALVPEKASSAPPKEAITKKESMFAKKDDPPSKDTKPADTKAAATTKPLAKKGTLDFSKSKSKEKEVTKPKEEPPKKMFFKAEPASSKVKKEESESEQEPTKPATKPKPKTASPTPAEPRLPEPAAPKRESSTTGRVRKRVVLSDDDDDEPPPPPRRKAKPVAVEEDDEGLMAMMDVDDDQVERVSRLTKRTSVPEPEPAEDTDAAEVPSSPAVDETMDESDHSREVKPLPKQRKPKKVVPIGANGLKKKRVVKTRSKTDEKGYQVTEDYSDYESVDEEEPAPAPKVKAPAKPSAEKPKAEVKPEKPPAAATTESSKPKPKPKPQPKAKAPATKGAAGQAKLGNFFGPAKTKKSG
ncbi:DNA polymerase subunit Cdc27-domain-containing protein [Pterulicium gracile]|uniref:DNA polymerase delta subunit 3 n=1 Tax=Pterulicium gracile TaxID=1884261 RepID=A0A5C3QKC9_9AGAR|nr:DNA polymerase subunit Cdc27-domain-containing protein [Pterula gracilis]